MKLEKIPVHVGIIMDGNGRWAKKRGLPRIEGHKKGAEVAEKIISFAKELGIKYITLYAFSTENWKRPKEEVNFLFTLMYQYILTKLPKFIENDTRFKVIGRIDELPDFLKEGFRDIERKTAHCSSMTAVFAVNYGGRQEIVDAVKKIVEKGEPVTEEAIAKNLYFPELPDVDLIIRTSGEMRISNFLLWRASYAELWFTKTLWPDFTEEEFLEAIKDYSKRERRFGGV